ncbi:MAG: nucleotidyltransferase family protein [Longimicrobiales bacterium]
MTAPPAGRPARGGDATPYAGVIPAAGASSRMGRPKALLPVQGESFLARTVHALSRGGCSPVWVVLAAGERTMAAEAESAGARVLYNLDPGEGPITSLRIALAALDETTPGVAYLPVDHPMVRSETVAQLLVASRAAGAALTVPMHEGKRGHPAIFGAALFDELADPTLVGGARTVVHRHLDRALKVDVADSGVLADIDTPDAYSRVLGVG